MSEDTPENPDEGLFSQWQKESKKPQLPLSYTPSSLWNSIKERGKKPFPKAVEILKKEDALASQELLNLVRRLQRAVVNQVQEMLPDTPEHHRWETLAMGAKDGKLTMQLVLRDAKWNAAAIPDSWKEELHTSIMRKSEGAIEDISHPAEPAQLHLAVDATQLDAPMLERYTQLYERARKAEAMQLESALFLEENFLTYLCRFLGLGTEQQSADYKDKHVIPVKEPQTRRLLVSFKVPPEDEKRVKGVLREIYDPEGSSSWSAGVHVDAPLKEGNVSLWVDYDSLKDMELKDMGESLAANYHHVRREQASLQLLLNTIEEKQSKQASMGL